MLEVAFASPPRTNPRATLVKVVAAHTHDGGEFRAKPGVLLPLISIGVGMAPGSSRDQVFVHAVCRKGEPVVITMSRDCPVEGDEYTFEPPLVVPPMLVAAQTAAKLSSASFEIRGGAVVLSCGVNT